MRLVHDFSVAVQDAKCKMQNTKCMICNIYATPFAFLPLAFLTMHPLNTRGPTFRHLKGRTSILKKNYSFCA